MNRKVFFYLLGCLILILKHDVWSQETPVIEEQQLENLAEINEEDIEDDQIIQQLFYLRKHPISINTANAEDLRQLKWLTDLQIENLILYRKKLGKLISKYELQAVPAWDLVTIRRSLPFIIIDNNGLLGDSFAKRFRNGDYSILARVSRVLENQRGYNKELSSYYEGNKDHLLIRYKYQYKNLLQYGITAEKDPGEAFFRGQQVTGFDFYSYHFFLRNLNKIKAIALGDYAVNMGQGLIQWHSMAFRKSPETMQVKRQASVLMPYNSAAESRFYRGAGLTMQLGQVEWSGFISYRNVSANIDTVEDLEIFTSFHTSGLHRTPSEIAGKNALSHFTTGGNLGLKRNSFKLGMNLIHHRFSKPLLKNAKPYNLYAIESREWSNYSMDYAFTFRNMHFFGEAAIDQKGGKALLAGSLWSLHPQSDVSIIYRNINQQFQSLSGNSFTENTYPANERGIYTGFTIRPMFGWKLDAYIDLYQFPWIKHRVDGMSGGKDILTQIIYQPSKILELSLRYRAESKSENVASDGSALHTIEEKQRQNLRFQAIYQVLPGISIKNRTELLWYDPKGAPEEGFLTYLQIGYSKHIKWAGNLRLQYFESKSYNSRIYAFENDVLYGYSIPAFYDKGFRYYLNINYDITKRLTIWTRWAQTIYKDKAKIGSGLDEISGKQRSEVRLQARYFFKS